MQYKTISHISWFAQLVRSIVLVLCLLLSVSNLSAQSSENNIFTTRIGLDTAGSSSAASSVASSATGSGSGSTTLKANRPKVGLVLSGGGAKGIAHVGILKLLEELNIPIDYIAGTSMGSIVGGLYAYGYTASELDSIFRAADWNLLLSDKPLRKDIYLSEKLSGDQYILTLPISKNTSILPIGILKGQHINNLFYTLTAEAHKSPTFEDLNIPFRCVAADILSGNGVVFKDGNLAQAMRASMAIPGVFTPIEIDTMVLVDGGLVDNFPAEELIDMGADIIIGVDVGFQYSGKQKIRNLANILESTMFMHSKATIMQNRDICNVLITPNLKGYSSYSFGATDSLLAVGERAALEHYDELKAIADDLALYESDPPIEKKPYKIQELVYLSGIAYEGFDKFSSQYANQLLQIDAHSWVKHNDIIRGVERLYGSMVFEEVAYEFLKDTLHPDQTILKIKVEETPTNGLRLGLRYDNQRSAALLAGIVLRNLGIPNARLTLDAEVSRLPMLNADFWFMPQWKKSKQEYSFWRPGIGISYNLYLLSKEYLYEDLENRNSSTGEFSIQSHKIKIYAQSNWKQNILGAGLELSYHHNNQKSYINALRTVENLFYLEPSLYFLHDSYDAKFFPKKGIKANIGVSFPISLANYKPFSSYFLTAHAFVDFAISPTPWFSIYPGFAAAATLLRTTSSIPIQYLYYQGGLAPVQNGPNEIMFPGVLPFQARGQNMWNAHLNLQFLTIKNLYLSAKGAVGMATDELFDMKDWNKSFIYGGALGISYNTPIGPVGLNFQSSNIHPFNIWLSILYWL